MFEKRIGSAAEVFHGTARETPGGVTKEGLFQDSKDGRIKSKAKSMAAKKNPALKQWRTAVTKAKKELDIPKGEFALVKGKLLKETKKIFKTKKTSKK